MSPARLQMQEPTHIYSAKKPIIIGENETDAFKHVDCVQHEILPAKDISVDDNPTYVMRYSRRLLENCIVNLPFNSKLPSTAQLIGNDLQAHNRPQTDERVFKL